MGEGNYRPQGAVTRQCHPYDDIDASDADMRSDAWFHLVEQVRDAAGRSASPVERDWRDRNARVVARTGLHDITLYENSYGTVFISVWPRRDLDVSTETLATASLDRVSEAFFRRLSLVFDLYIATTAWTSARWVPAQRRAA